MNYFVKRRLYVLYWTFVFVFLALGGHLAYIQAVKGKQLSYEALSQQSQTIPLEIPVRGQILDCKLRPMVSYNEPYRIIVFPAAVRDQDTMAALISSTLDMNLDSVRKFVEGKPQIIPYDLNADQVAVLKQAKLPGMIVTRIKIRERQPGTASHTIGYTARGNGVYDWVGKSGIELLFNQYLTGQVPQARVRIYLDGRGQYISGLNYRVESGLKDPEKNSIVMTIDRDIQKIVERTVYSAGIRDGAVVVMDVHSGDIVAMASVPGYHLKSTASIREDANDNSFVNRGLSQYQPGSVFKVVVASAAIEEGVVRPDTPFLCVGEKDQLVKCYEKQGHGILNFSTAVAVSCNPTFARVGIKLGAAELIRYAKRFGLGETDIIGYREIGSDKSLEKIAKDYNLVNASIGQWPVESSVVQTTAMMNTIANNGVYLKPRLVREVRNYQGKTVKQFAVDSGSRAVSFSTAKTVQAMLQLVTQEGTGKKAWLPGWGSAGKTGSAQVAQEKTDAWFSGYAPLSDPKYTITVMVNDGESGGKTAAPVFKEIMQQILALENK